MKRIALISILLVLFASLSYAEEDITITTYYPSPYGEYNDLGLNMLSFNPQAGAPAVQEGRMYYDSTSHGLFVRNNTGWVQVGGGGVTSVLLDAPTVLSGCGSSFVVSGTIQAGVTTGVPTGAKEVLLFAVFDSGDSSNGGGGISFKHPSHANWKPLVDATNIYYTNENSVWVPLDNLGRLEWKQKKDTISSSCKHTFEIQGYRM